MIVYLLIGLSWVLVGLALLVLRLLKEREPERQWRLLLVAAVAPFALFQVVRVCSALAGEAIMRVPLLGSAWPLALLTGGGAVIAGVRSLIVLRRQRALLAVCQPPPRGVAETLGDRLGRLSQAAGLRQPPRLLVFPGRAHVCALGWRRPTIVLSEDLLTALGAEELEGILAHELAHLRQRDYLLNWLGLIARSALFYLPPSSLGWRVLSEVRERRADRLAVHYTGNPLALAAALIKVWQLWPARSAPAGALGFLERSGNLEARVRRLIEPDPPSRPVWRASLSAGLLLAGLAFVHATVEGGTHFLARVSPDVAALERCCDPAPSPVPHCVAPRRIFLSCPTTGGSSSHGTARAWMSSLTG